MGVCRRSWSVVLGGLIAVTIAGCYSPPPMDVDGDLQVRDGPQLGDWDLEPALCIAGSSIGIKGVDVSSYYGERCVRFVDHPVQGPTIIAYVPGTDEGYEFTPSECATFDVRLERVVNQFDDVYNEGGHIRVDCSNEFGRIEGAVQFDGCF